MDKPTRYDRATCCELGKDTIWWDVPVMQYAQTVDHEGWSMCVGYDGYEIYSNVDFCPFCGTLLSVWQDARDGHK